MRPENRRPNGALVAATCTLGLVLLVLACCWTLLITGVLTWR